ncbi:YxD-tail cyclophane-containing RiPP peptide [Streptomyces sp. NPDC051940]
MPDFTGLDARAVAERTAHPVLAEVLTGLLSHWPAEGDAVAYYEDSPE